MIGNRTSYEELTCSSLATEMIKPVTPPGQLARGISPNGEFTAIINGGKLSLHSLAGGRDIAVGAVEPGVFVIRFSGDGRYLSLDESRRRCGTPPSSGSTFALATPKSGKSLKLTDPAESFFGSFRLTLTVSRTPTLPARQRHALSH